MDVGDYYSKSFHGFKENLNIAVPSLVGTIITFVIMLFVVLLILFGFLGVQSLTNGTLAPESVPNFSTTAIIASVTIILIAVIISAIINSFIYAATVGMAEKIVEGQKPALEVAWENGKKYFIKILVVSIIAGLIAMVLSLPFILGIVLYSVSSVLGLIVTVIGLLILVVGVILLALGLMVINQSIVIGKKSVTGSIKDSIQVFMENKLKVFLVAIINMAIALGISLVLSLIPFAGSFLNMIAGIILTPYFALVVTHLYMDTKGQLPVHELNS